MGKIVSKFMACCYDRENEEDQYTKPLEKELEKNPKQFEYLDNHEYGTLIKYYILNNTNRQY